MGLIIPRHPPSQQAGSDEIRALGAVRGGGGSLATKDLAARTPLSALRPLCHQVVALHSKSLDSALTKVCVPFLHSFASPIFYPMHSDSKNDLIENLSREVKTKLIFKLVQV